MMKNLRSLEAGPFGLAAAAANYNDDGNDYKEDSSYNRANYYSLLLIDPICT